MAAPTTGTGTIISERYLDVPTQRLLAVGVLVASQAVKAGDFLANLADYNDLSSYKLLLKWNLIDAASLWLLPLFRIPRLAFHARARTAQIILFFTFNWLLFGNYTFSLGRFVPVPIRGVLSIFEYDELAISQRRVRIQDVVDYGSHLLGQHTVRLSPISTARLNPENLPFCLASPAVGVFIPILLNNTKSPSLISYSVAALADQGPRMYVNVTSRELKKMQSTAASLIAQQEKLHSSTSPYDSEDDDDDEFGAEDDTLYKKKLAEKRKQQQLILPSSTSFSRSMLDLAPTQKLIYLRITRPGLVRLERLLDQSGADARISRRIGLVEATVVECPSARWDDGADAGTLCASSGGKEVSIHVRGTAPMTLKWHHLGTRGEKEEFTVEGIKGSNEAEGLPLAQDVRIPLTLRLNNPGIHAYSLESLTDGTGNTIDLVGSTRAFTVFGQSSVAFRGCSTGPDKTVSLLHGKTTKLLVSLNEVDTLDAPWTAKIRFQPPLALESQESASRGKSGRMTAQPWIKEYTIPRDKKTIAVEVDQAGDYTIVSVSGSACPGEVLSPETCRVVEQPLPTAEIEFKSIHECASDTGVTAIAVLHGTPPFVLYYTVKHDKNPPRTVTRTFNAQRAEIVLKPEQSGTYTYTFSHLTDKYYSRVPLEGNPSTTQRVHPLAVAQFVGGPNSVTASNCEGRSVNLELDLRGSPPFSVEMQLVGPKGSDMKTFSNLKDSREKVDVPILEDLDLTGGVMEIDLVSVQDATGCKRPLDVPGATVHVKRVKPTVKFYYPDGKQDILKLFDETAVLPLRLTGDGPWEVAYTMSLPGGLRIGDIKRMRVSSANERVSVDKEGVYELVEVRDIHCPGVVVPEAATYQVRNVQKPAGVFSINTGEITTSGTIIRRPVCVGVEDYADIDLEGRPPFQVRYRYANQLRGRYGAADYETFNSIQKTSRLQLRTSEPGHHEYHLIDFGDAAYPLQHLKDRPQKSAPRYSGTVLQHEVLSRPSAHFKASGPSSYCLNEKLVPRSGRHDDPTVFLTGKPPFKLNLNIKNVATSESRTAVVEVSTHEWKVDVPTYVLQTVGPHLVSIESFEDSSPCSPSDVDHDRRTFRIDVAETAAIVPFDRREDWCVGDILQFQLEGNAPWRVDYQFDGRAISATSKTSKFSRVAEKAGIFEITGVAHQQASCQSKVSDMRFTVRDLPSARVSHGNIVYEDLREGDQAEILFSLIGTPPFTFTYQRTSLETLKGAPHILETHTVSGVMGHEYSIFSALEGTWTVTFIADKYCRYPPAPQRAENA